MQFTGHGQVREQWAVSLWDVDADIGDFKDDSSLPVTDGDKWLFFVHHDSLSALEPQVGDVVRYWVTHEPDYFSQSESKRTKEHTKKLTKATMFYIKHQSGLHKLMILQRNGIPFHWPKKDVDKGTHAT